MNNNEVEQILADFGNALYDYITEHDIIKAAEIYAEKPMYKTAQSRINQLLVGARISELEWADHQVGEHGVFEYRIKELKAQLKQDIKP